MPSAPLTENSAPSPAPVYGATNPTPEQIAARPARSYAGVVGLATPALEQKYRELHADVWPEVIAALGRANIRNYHIYAVALGGHRYLFSHFDYTGADPDADFGALARNPVVRDQWTPLVSACQVRLPDTPAGEQWLEPEQLMHLP